jgi:hypothetical protein
MSVIAAPWLKRAPGGILKGRFETPASFFLLYTQADNDTDKILGRLSGRAYIDTNRIAKLERQLKALRFQLYVLAVTVIIASVAFTMILVRATWHLRP